MAKRHWMAALLIVSLGINLLAAGVLVGRWSVSGPPPPMSWAFKGMDPELRTQLRPKLQETMADIAPLRAEFRRTARKIRDIAAAEPLDSTALAEALEELRQVSQRYQIQVHDAALDVLPELSSRQRLQVLRRVFESHVDRRAGGRRPGDDAHREQGKPRPSEPPGSSPPPEGDGSSAQ
ncbi:MAG: periplasmic heavy metal sensor [Cellvibrionales bacterium]